MKKILFLLAAFCPALLVQKAQAQNVSEPQINISAVTDSFPANGIGKVLVKLCNNGETTIEAGRLRPLISVPAERVHILSASNADGSALSSFKVQNQTDGTIRLLYEKALEGHGCVSFHVNAKLESPRPGPALSFLATLGFQGPQPHGNNIGNDNALTTILVGQ